MLRRPSLSSARRILGPASLALIYIAVGVTWIIASDRILYLLVADPDQIAALQNVKGVLYVAITGILLYVLVRRDVNTLRASEARMREAKERAEDLNQMRSTFLANMSHEIRTPLTSIIGFAEILEEESEPQHREFARLISDSGLRLLDTLNSVLDLARIESGQMHVHRETVNLLHEVEHAVETYRRRAADRGLDVVLEAPHRFDQAVFLDPAILFRILSNLLTNAIKFTHSGQITVTVSRTPTHAELRVADTGIGISEAYVPYLFDEFRQESTGLARQFEGAGLGLAVTRRLTEAIGGEIYVESTKGEGSAFTLRLPLLSTADDRPPAAAS